MILKTSFYDQLRTTEQLGYVVSNGISDYRGVLA